MLPIPHVLLLILDLGGTFVFAVSATVVVGGHLLGVSPVMTTAVGGAGALEVAPGMQALDTPGFPDAYKPEATAGRAFLEVLRKETALDWTFLSPSAEFVPGERTGKFRVGHPISTKLLRGT